MTNKELIDYLQTFPLDMEVKAESNIFSDIEFVDIEVKTVDFENMEFAVLNDTLLTMYRKDFPQEDVDNIWKVIESSPKTISKTFINIRANYLKYR